MSEYESVFRRKELHDMFSSGEVKPLDDLYLIEDTALTVQELTKRLDFYQDYKKKKMQDIVNEMKVIENKIDFFKNIIVSTLKHNKEKSIKFPGSCSVSSRDQKSRWQIDDEEEFIAVLQEAEKTGEDVDDVLDIVQQYNIRKREADKLLDAWEQNGKLVGFLKKAKDGKAIVSKLPPKTTVALKFFDEDGDDSDNLMNESLPIKGEVSSKNTEDYDAL
jgi:hypothetical protein